MTISLRLNDEDTLLIKKYAELNKMSVSELIRQTVMERIENEYDLELFNKAINEYKDDPVTYSLDEVEILAAEAAMPGLAALEAEAAEQTERIRVRITDQVEFEG